MLRRGADGVPGGRVAARRLHPGACRHVVARLCQGRSGHLEPGLAGGAGLPGGRRSGRPGRRPGGGHFVLLHASASSVVRRAHLDGQVRSRRLRRATSEAWISPRMDQVAVVELQGVMSFGVAAFMAEQVQQLLLPRHRWLLLDASRVPAWDTTALVQVRALARDLAQQGVQLQACGMDEGVRQQLGPSVEGPPTWTGRWNGPRWASCPSGPSSNAPCTPSGMFWARWARACPRPRRGLAGTAGAAGRCTPWCGVPCGRYGP